MLWKPRHVRAESTGPYYPQDTYYPYYYYYLFRAVLAAAFISDWPGPLPGGLALLDVTEFDTVEFWELPNLIT